MSVLNRPKIQEKISNTLAQSGTKQTEQHAVVISGKGTEMNASKPIKGKAKRKLIT